MMRDVIGFERLKKKKSRRVKFVLLFPTFLNGFLAFCLPAMKRSMQPIEGSEA